MGLPNNFEFHFTDDGHERRLAFLSTVQRSDFACYTFTLDKASPKLIGPGLRHRESAYKWGCRIALQNAASDLNDATVVIDSSGDRTFRRQLATYLRRELNDEDRKRVKKVSPTRSQSDPLLQLADYVAGVTNRLWLDKAGCEVYEQYLRRKRRSLRKWP